VALNAAFVVSFVSVARYASCSYLFPTITASKKLLDTFRNPSCVSFC
jgi:hypothetical protein